MPLTTTAIDNIFDFIRHHPKLIIAEDYEIALQTFDRVSTQHHNGQKISEHIEDSAWVSLRILHRKRAGRSYTTSTTKAGLVRLIEDAFVAAELSSADPWFRFPWWRTPAPSFDEKLYFSQPPAPHDRTLYPYLAWKPEFLEETYETTSEFVRLYRKMEKNQYRFGKNGHVWKFRAGHTSKEDWLGWTDEDHSKTLHMSAPPCFENLMKSVRASLSLPEHAIEPSEKILFSSAAWIAVLKRTAPWFFGDRMLNQEGPLWDQKGSLYFSDKITLLEGGTESTPFDLEGTPCTKTVLVSDGKVQDFLFDMYFATKENRLGTGNLVRAPDSMIPEIGITHLALKPGTTPEAEMLNALRDGFYLEHFDSLTFDPVSLTGNVKGKGWNVKNGVKTSWVASVALPVSLPTLWKKVSHVSDTPRIQAQYSSPSVLIDLGLG